MAVQRFGTMRRRGVWRTRFLLPDNSVSAVPQEERRLRDAIAAERARLAAAEARLAAQTESFPARLGEVVIDAHRELLELRREHERRIADIMAASESDAARITAAARTQAFPLLRDNEALADVIPIRPPGAAHPAGTDRTRVST